jgi:hypothetical protein
MAAASLLPTGLVHDLLTRGPQIGLTPPATVDLLAAFALRRL